MVQIASSISFALRGKPPSAKLFIHLDNPIFTFNLKTEQTRTVRAKNSYKKPNIMSQKVWPRRAEFVDAVLVLGCSYSVLDWGEVVLDGVAGEKFDKVVELAQMSANLVNDCIQAAISFGVPVEGLVADGEFGPKWAEVVRFCKEADPSSQAQLEWSMADNGGAD